MAARLIKRPHMLSEYFKHSNQIDKHNHARQSELAIEKNVIAACGYFRLWCTYLGITVTDAWKLYRAGLDDKHVNKEISIHSFANILTRTHLLNDYSKHCQYESITNQTLNPSSRQELQFPSTVETSLSTNVSSLGSGSSGGLVQIGNGRYVSATFLPEHKEAICVPTNEYIPSGKGSYSEKRRKRNRCRVCQANTTCQCTICHQWLCNPHSSSQKACFTIHQTQKVLDERTAHWHSLQLL